MIDIFLFENIIIKYISLNNYLFLYKGGEKKNNVGYIDPVEIDICRVLNQ